MGLFNTIGRTIDAVASPIIRVASVADESLDAAALYVNNRATALKLTDKQQVIHDTTETLRPIQERLQSDEKFKALFDDVAKHFE